jgi:hypothetical protein
MKTNKQIKNNYVHDEINFRRHWTIIVWAFVIIFFSISFLAWQIYLSNQIAGGLGTLEESDSSETELTLDEGKILEALSIMETRQNGFGNSTNTSKKVVDPAL